MYNLTEYGQMIADRTRMAAYEAALARAVRPGSVVLDIGTGVGLFAFLALRLGARRVIAVEPADAIQVAREIAAVNGLADRVEFFDVASEALVLDEPVDVIVSDLRGVLPLFDRHLPAIIDARTRLLAPGGVLIPLRDELHVSLIEDASTRERILRPWATGDHGLDLGPARRRVLNQWFQVDAEPAQMLAAPRGCGTLDYASLASTDFSADVELVAQRDGTAHGICLWFDATLAEGIGYSNAPVEAGNARPLYRNACFPLSEPVAVRAGDRLLARLRANLVAGAYLWRWHLGTAPVGPSRRIEWQSSLAGEIIVPGQFPRLGEDTIVALGASGLLDATTLELMRDGLTLRQIATRLIDAHPGRFASVAVALEHVRELFARYSA